MTDTTATTAPAAIKKPRTPTQKLRLFRQRAFAALVVVIVLLLGLLAWVLREELWALVNPPDPPTLSAPVLDAPVKGTTADAGDESGELDTIPAETPEVKDAGSDEEPAAVIDADTEEKVCELKEETPPEACLTPPKDDPCDMTLIADLEKYFEYRQWDTEHIAIIERAFQQPMLDWDSPVHYKEYEFWGDDGPNLRAFIRDQRLGVLDGETYVVYATSASAETQIRYTIFRCECGVTAIYREIRETVIKKPPPKKYTPVPPPVDDIPGIVCVDPRTRVKKTCV